MVLLVKYIIPLLEFCLRNTYFSFQDQFYEQVEGTAMGSLASPIVANLYMEYFEQKALSTATHPLECGSDMWMIPVSSKTKNTNKPSLNTLTVLTQPQCLQWKTTGRMVPSPSWIPLSNQKPMVDCLSQYIGNPPKQTNIYSWTVTITYQPIIV